VISVVIPLFNKAPYVVEAVRSALACDYPPHEVIVVDDGSTDDGPQRVRALADPRVRLVSQPNRGVSAARNRGIDEAHGEYVAFLDADDYWTQRYLGAIAELIARFPGCGMYGTHFYYFRNDGSRQVPRLRGMKAGPQRVERFFEHWSRGVLFNTSAVVIPRRLLGAAGIGFLLLIGLWTPVASVLAAVAETELMGGGSLGGMLPRKSVRTGPCLAEINRWRVKISPPQPINRTQCHTLSHASSSGIPPGAGRRPESSRRRINSCQSRP